MIALGASVFPCFRLRADRLACVIRRACTPRLKVDLDPSLTDRAPIDDVEQRSGTETLKHLARIFHAGA